MTVLFRALGTSAVVATADDALAGDACAAVERELDAIDRACSRFRPDSELARRSAWHSTPHAQVTAS
jgi:thiamine biosynthesis lipoprotein